MIVKKQLGNFAGDGGEIGGANGERFNSISEIVVMKNKYYSNFMDYMIHRKIGRIVVLVHTNRYVLPGSENERIVCLLGRDSFLLLHRHHYELFSVCRSNTEKSF